jgi:hypothetical protein
MSSLRSSSPSLRPASSPKSLSSSHLFPDTLPTTVPPAPDSATDFQRRVPHTQATAAQLQEQRSPPEPCTPSSPASASLSQRFELEVVDNLSRSASFSGADRLASSNWHEDNLGSPDWIPLPPRYTPLRTHLPHSPSNCPPSHPSAESRTTSTPSPLNSTTPKVSQNRQREQRGFHSGQPTCTTSQSPWAIPSDYQAQTQKSFPSRQCAACSQHHRRLSPRRLTPHWHLTIWLSLTMQAYCHISIYLCSIPKKISAC